MGVTTTMRILKPKTAYCEMEYRLCRLAGTLGVILVKLLHMSLMPISRFCAEEPPSCFFGFFFVIFSVFPGEFWDSTFYD